MTSELPPGPFKLGDRIFDKYEVRGLLGRGGHAFVYDCYSSYLNEFVAVKVIPDSPLRGKQLFNRARGEAQFLYRLNHPNVVRVMDADDIGGMAVMVMEKLVGMNLREYLLACGPLTPLEALTIARQIASALVAAHGMNVIHRDLKPENIFVMVGNRVKVLDFGIAKFLEGHQTTQRDLIQGTAPYMSPEQAQGFAITFASDIFQLATIIFEMITGICPCFVGVEEPSPQVVLAIQITKVPPRLKSLVPSVPDWLDQLVWQALAKNPEQRQSSMREVGGIIDDGLRWLRERLPPEERMIRSLRLPARDTAGAERNPSSNQKSTFIDVVADQPTSSPAPGVVERTAVIAPQTQPAPTVSSPQSRAPRSAEPARQATTVRNDFSSAALARAIQPSVDGSMVARRSLLRGLLIGAAVSVPAGAMVFRFVKHADPRGAASASAVALPMQATPAAAVPSISSDSSVAAAPAPPTVAPAPEAPLPSATPPVVVQRPRANPPPSKATVSSAAPSASQAGSSLGWLDRPIFPPLEDDVPPKPSKAPRAASKPAASTSAAPKKLPKLIF